MGKFLSKALYVESIILECRRETFSSADACILVLMYCMCDAFGHSLTRPFCAQEIRAGQHGHKISGGDLLRRTHAPLLQ